MDIIFARYLPLWLLAAGVLLLLITGRPMLRRRALAAKNAEFKSLGIASPVLNTLILISVIGKPFLEHLQKNDWKTDLLDPQLDMLLMMIFIMSLYAMLGTTVYFFFRAIRNINAFSGEKMRSPYSAFLMLIPITNLIVIPYLEYFAYQRSSAFAVRHHASKLRAALLAGSAFALLVVSLAFGRLGDDASQSTNYDALSLFVLSVSTAGAGGILSTRIFDRISKAQELYARQLSAPVDGKSYAESAIHSRTIELFKSGGVAVLLFAALATAVFPSLPSRLLEFGSQSWSTRL